MVSSPLHRRTDLTWSDIRDLWHHRGGEDGNLLQRMIIFHREGEDDNLFMAILALLPTDSLQSSSSNELPFSYRKKMHHKDLNRMQGNSHVPYQLEF